MKHPLSVCLATIIGGLSAMPAVAGYVFTILDVPGANWTNASSINGSGQVAGQYTDAIGYHGYLYCGGTFTTLDPPGATYSNALSINANGQVVGNYFDATGWHGFIYSGGAYTTLDAAPGAYSTEPSSINASGQVAGTVDGKGFVYSGGAFTSIAVPGVSTSAYSINDSGQVAGAYNQQGFVYSGGFYTLLNPPGSTFAQAVSINNNGQVAGWYHDSTGGEHGFVYSSGAFAVLNVPGATKTDAFSINSSGQVAGVYSDSTGQGAHGFVYSGGSFTTLGAPGTSVIAHSINDSGQVAGWYSDIRLHGFTASFSATPSELACWFNWEETNNPSLYAPAGSPTHRANYAYRYYSTTNAYLGINSVNKTVYYQGTNGKLRDEGPLSDWLTKTSCQTNADPEQCLFNWAESNYPAELAPAGSATQSGTFTNRYYSATNTYLGVASYNNHVYSQKAGGTLQDQGSLLSLLPPAGCQ